MIYHIHTSKIEYNLYTVHIGKVYYMISGKKYARLFLTFFTL